MTQLVQFETLVNLLERILIGCEANPAVARQIAFNCAACERDGSKSHGIFRMRGYVSTIRSGWVDPRATPVLEEAGTSFLRVDARNGFAQPALAVATDQARKRARDTGTCIIAIRDSHHFSALWPDVEPFAEDGLIALSVVNSMAVTVPVGARRPVFGTNPIAFSAPVAGQAPFVFDMATSAWSHGDIQIALREGRPLPEGVGVDAKGRPTTDPAAVLDGGALLPFGGHKGSALSMMIELLGAALTGGFFSTEVDWSGFPGAVIPHTGQVVIVIDPGRAGGAGFAPRAAELVQTLRDAGLEMVPGERRHRNRAASLAYGIRLDDAEWADLRALAADCVGQVGTAIQL